jgi:hypothetical protein
MAYPSEKGGGTAVIVITVPMVTLTAFYFAPLAS